MFKFIEKCFQKLILVKGTGVCPGPYRQSMVELSAEMSTSNHSVCLSPSLLSTSFYQLKTIYN